MIRFIIFGAVLLIANSVYAEPLKKPPEEEVISFIQTIHKDEKNYGANVPRGPLRVGMIFRPIGGKVTVEQVIAESSFRGTFQFNVGHKYSNGDVGNKFVEGDAWFNMSVEGIADGQTIAIKDQFLFVTDTRKYATALGSQRTVFEMRPINTAEIVPIAKEIAEKRKEAEFRTWTDATGKYSVEARFSQFKDGKVHLQKSNGDVLKLSMQKLSENDQAFVRKQLKLKSKSR